MNIFNIKELLLANNFKIISETDKEIRCLCIWHNDNTPSFSISKETGKWICFNNCGKGTFSSFLKKIKCTYNFNTKDFISASIDAKINPKASVQQDINAIVFPSEFISFEHASDIPIKMWNYITGRLTKETIYKFNLHYSINGKFGHQAHYERIIVPIYFKKMLVAFLSRAVNAGDKRYLNPYDLKFSNFLFNYDAIIPESELILCESTFDCMSAVEKGYTSSIATFGANLSSKQKKLLAELKPKKLIVCFHRDKAGNSALYKNLEYLRTLAPIEKLYLPPDKDINECTKEEFDRCFNKKLNISSKTNYMKNKIFKQLSLLV